MSWRFAVLIVAILLFTELLMLGILLIPPSLGPLSAFAADFKVWCFGYDPATGSLEWGYVWMLTVQPFLLLFVVMLLWHRPLKEILKTRPTAILPYVGEGFLLVAVMGFTLPAIGGTEPVSGAGLAFPAAELRTERMAPDFSVVDQDGEELSLSDLRGRVVFITAVYSSCGDTCPLILQQTKRVLDRMSEEERRELDIIALTLDPEVDTPRVMKALLTAHGLAAYGVRAGTGDPAEINRILDVYGFSRKKNPETGLIQHANRLLAVDRQGHIAYTFALGATQEQWLGEALHLLLSEPGPATAEGTS